MCCTVQEAASDTTSLKCKVHKLDQRFLIQKPVRSPSVDLTRHHFLTPPLWLCTRSSASGCDWPGPQSQTGRSSPIGGRDAAYNPKPFFPSRGDYFFSTRSFFKKLALHWFRRGLWERKAQTPYGQSHIIRAVRRAAGRRARGVNRLGRKSGRELIRGSNECCQGGLEVSSLGPPHRTSPLPPLCQVILILLSSFSSLLLPLCSSCSFSDPPTLTRAPEAKLRGPTVLYLQSPLYF